MTLRYLLSGVSAVVIACGLTVSVYAQRDGGLLPPSESGMVTVAGCLLRGNQVTDGDSDKYVLADLKRPVDSVAEETCSADPNATAVQLDNPKKANINEAMLGRWVEISGRLEKETSHDNILRELDVTNARLVPVEIPRIAAAPPEPEPEPQAAAEPTPAPEPAPVPVATSGQADLPKTASPLPFTGLIGLLACAGGLVVRSFRSRQRA